MKVRVLSLIGVMSVLLTGCEFKEILNFVEQQIPVESSDVMEEYNNHFEPKVESDYEFVFESAEVKGKDTLEGVPLGKTDIRLYLGDLYYFDVQVPDALEYVTDNVNYIYSTDGIVEIKLLTNITAEDFGKTAYIENARVLKTNLISTQDVGKKKPQEAFLHIVNDKVLWVKTYDSNSAFEIILDGMINRKCIKSAIDSVALKDNGNLLNTLPAMVGYHREVPEDLVDTVHKVYKFDDGILVMDKEYSKFEDVVKSVSKKVSVVIGQAEVDSMYFTDGIYYAEVGDFTVGVRKMNYNTVIACYGDGLESRYNIISFLKRE